MNTKTFISLVQQPDLLNSDQLLEIEKIIATYPFFQAPKAIYLKGLKNQESYRYNNALKHTAAYTTDRYVLFDFITSEVFKKQPEEATILKTALENNKIEDIEVAVSQGLDPTPNVPLDQVSFIPQQETDAVLAPELPITTADSVTENELLTDQMDPEAILKPDQPLEFDQNELHSFGEWMKIAALQPINRMEGASEKRTKVPGTPKGEVEEEVAQEEVTQQEVAQQEVAQQEVTQEEVVATKEKGLQQEDKFRLIDDFIAKNPKIGRVSQEASPANLAKKQQQSTDTLMTETLAKVYVAQKNYKKAIQAYNILILKNPEKSGFFADQIRAIKKLQDS